MTFLRSTTQKVSSSSPSIENRTSNGAYTSQTMTIKPTIKVIPNGKLFVSEPNPVWFGNPPSPNLVPPTWTNKNWLKSRFHFSFAEYHSPRNLEFGPLRVMNDDLVQPHRGFGKHPHQNMEIITYVVSGKLTHKDSIGTKETLGRGSIQFMTAGSGIRHSEENNGDTPLRFIQTWIIPRQRDLEPNYGSFARSEAYKKNEIHHLVSDVSDESTSTPVKINQDVDGYAAQLELGQTVHLDLSEGRQAYFLCIEGSVKVNGRTLSKYDACEITKGGVLKIKATDVEATESGQVAHFLMFTMQEVPGSGRSDI